MLAGERATSSKDPYALRRNVISILRIILERDINIDLGRAIKFIAQLFDVQASQEIFLEIELFVVDRLKNLLSKTFDVKILNAVLSSDLSNVRAQVERGKKLAEFCKTPEWEKLLSSYKRLVNILGKKADFGKADAALFKTGFEQNLFNSLAKASKATNNADLFEGLNALLSMVEIIEEFFENVMVNDDDKTIAQNRQNLIFAAKSCFEQVLQFQFFL